MSTSSAKIVYKPRRGRPDAKQAAAIDQAILTAARRHFLEGGYDAAAMENIAAEAGVSKATLYVRYPTKGDLFRSVIQERVEQWAQLSAQDENATGHSLRERLLYYGLLIARTLPIPEVHAFQRLLIATRERFPELSLAMYESGSRPIADRIARDIAHFTNEEGLPANDPYLIARLFLSTMTGWQLQEGAARDMNSAELEDIARRVVDLFLLARAGW